MKIEITANNRTLQGKGASRRLRIAGKVPAVIYGGETPAQSIELDHNTLYHKLKLEAFHASILSIDVDGKKEKVLLRDTQMHPFKQQVYHVDFQRIDPKKKIHMKVPLHFINAESSPGVKTSGGNVSHVITEVDISCLPKDLPEFIAVDLVDMDVGNTLHLSDLVLPKDTEISLLEKGGSDLPVVTIVIPRALISEGDDDDVTAADETAADSEDNKEAE